MNKSNKKICNARHNSIPAPGIGILWSLLEINRTILSDRFTDKQTDRRNHGKTHMCRSQKQSPPASNKYASYILIVRRF